MNRFGNSSEGESKKSGKSREVVGFFPSGKNVYNCIFHFQVLDGQSWEFHALYTLSTGENNTVTGAVSVNKCSL